MLIDVNRQIKSNQMNLSLDGFANGANAPSTRHSRSGE